MNQYEAVLKDQISLKHVDRLLCIEVETRRIKLLSLAELQNHGSFPTSATLLPSGLINIGSACGQNWAKSERKLIFEKANSLANEMEVEWNTLSDQFHEETGVRHDLFRDPMFCGDSNNDKMACMLLQLIKSGKIQSKIPLRFDFTSERRPDDYIFITLPRILMLPSDYGLLPRKVQFGNWTLSIEETNKTPNLTLSALERFMLESAMNEMEVYPASGMVELQKLSSFKNLNGLYTSKWMLLDSPASPFKLLKFGSLLHSQWEDKMNMIVQGKPRYLQLAADPTLQENPYLQMLALEHSFLY
ncbi:unnamed protein product [Oikopleura dioica]|uniref:Uncharacterized protein n=1 Tax=Oikopleura dioica TaxID=34765 RepID=E4Y6H3_OIKDI|nr:unnamed protein product [Oikopleura dioica]